MTKIFYTKTDRSSRLGNALITSDHPGLYEVLRVELILKDISLAGRILANFPECLTDEQQQGDALAELGALAKTPEANIIKLPNISASIPQLTAAITELQAHGFNVPDFPEEPATEAEQDIRARYAKVLGKRRQSGFT